MKFKLGKKEYVLFPKEGILYFIFFLLLFVILLFIINFVILNSLKQQNIIAYSQNWVQEDNLINFNNHLKRGAILSNNINCTWLSDFHKETRGKIMKLSLCESSWAGNPLHYYTKDYITDFVWKDKAFKLNRKKSASKRILVLGDSFVWGHGYANMNDIWWRKLQRELVKRGYYDVEVMAIGWDADSTRDELENLKANFNIYKPDIVVWGFVTNDPDERLIMQRLEGDIEGAEDEIERKLVKKPDKVLKFLVPFRNVFPDLIHQLMQLRLNKLAQSDCYAKDPDVIYGCRNWELAIYKGKNFEKYKKTVNETRKFIHQHPKVPIFFVTLPVSPFPETMIPKFNKIKSTFKANDIKIYDLLPLFVKEFPNPGWGNQWKINPANAHPSPLTTDFYARQVANILERNYPKYLPKKYSGNPPKELFVNDWVPMSIDIKQKGSTLSFDYPVKNDTFLSLPYGYKFIQLNLSYAKKVKRVEVSGKNLLQTKIDVTYENPLDMQIYQLGSKKGHKVIFSNIDKKKSVNTIRLNAQFSSGKDRHITLKIITLN